MSPDGGLAIGTFPADSLRFGILMASSTDDCWKLAGECGRWAEEAQESATRLAFRQMAKVWAQLAFGQHFQVPGRLRSLDDLTFARHLTYRYLRIAQYYREMADTEPISTRAADSPRQQQ